MTGHFHSIIECAASVSSPAHAKGFEIEVGSNAVFRYLPRGQAPQNVRLDDRAGDQLLDPAEQSMQVVPRLRPVKLPACRVHD